MTRLVTIGPRHASPPEKALFAFATALGVLGVMTNVHLSVFLEHAWPQGTHVYYGALGFGGVLGILSTVHAPTDEVTKWTRWRMYGEIVALSSTGMQWGIWSSTGLSLGVNGLHGGLIGAALAVGNVWRIGQIVLDLDALDCMAVKDEAG